ncbi:hypothetical protein DL96DRAFT_1592722 [Flagelloscypha sp. PMI_526]|nr:hypothetical protein DL96DRAFT_1592722 [Flagelloscypha sp. PMI_526]
MTSSVSARHPLRDLDLSQFVSDTSLSPKVWAMPPSPVKLSPTKRRLLNSEGLQHRSYRASPYPLTVAAPMQSASTSRTVPRAHHQASENASPSSRPGSSGYASQDSASTHYCGFVIHCDAGLRSIPPITTAVPSLFPTTPEEDEDVKENSLPPPNRRLSVSGHALLFPPPLPLPFGNSVASRPQASFPGRSAGGKRSEDPFA